MTYSCRLGRTIVKMYRIVYSELLKAFNQGNTMWNLYAHSSLPLACSFSSYSITFGAHSMGHVLCYIPGIQWWKRDVTIHQLGLIGIYRHFISREQDYIFCSSHGTFAKADHSLDHKTYFTKFKRINSIQSMLPDYNGITLEMNHRKIARNPKVSEDQITHF